ncbi:hypothetical protein GGR57DRAFT_501158 [Xylariaceae sp. FL1272]|nr:hypothetical protein GGR57DRAFT_501158 [Xylariaceae sp. FL1272]
MPSPCSVCGKPAEKKCSRCREAVYCSHDCQKNDWKTHKKVCARIANANTHLDAMPKYFRARCMMRSHPQDWFRDQDVDTRDRALLDAEFLPFVQYNQASYVRKMYTMKEGDHLFQDVKWNVENDVNCKKIVAQAGGKLIGFPYGEIGSGNWKSIKIGVNIEVPKPAGLYFKWGIMGAKPSNVRIFRGPDRTCPDHPWDAMILRDCVASTDNFIRCPDIGTRKWDILAMKMCEDFDSPWILVAMRDVGAYNPEECTSCYAL